MNKKFKIAIIDYGAGNLRSVYNMVSKVSPESEIILLDSLQSDNSISHLILPGVGAFDRSMANLKAEIIDFIYKEVTEKKKPLLGICVGMQIMADYGYENDKSTKGLGLISGEVIPLSSPKIPHMGWNNIKVLSNSERFNLVQFDDLDFYFVHSFHFSCKERKNLVATTNYGSDFASIIAKENIIATQFHPEKSGANGEKFFQEFLKN